MRNNQQPDLSFCEIEAGTRDSVEAAKEVETLTIVGGELGNLSAIIASRDLFCTTVRAAATCETWLLNIAS